MSYKCLSYAVESFMPRRVTINNIFFLTVPSLTRWLIEMSHCHNYHRRQTNTYPGKGKSIVCSALTALKIDINVCLVGHCLGEQSWFIAPRSAESLVPYRDLATLFGAFRCFWQQLPICRRVIQRVNKPLSPPERKTNGIHLNMLIYPKPFLSFFCSVNAITTTKQH